MEACDKMVEYHWAVEVSQRTDSGISAFHLTTTTRTSRVERFNTPVVSSGGRVLEKQIKNVQCAPIFTCSLAHWIEEPICNSAGSWEQKRWKMVDIFLLQLSRVAQSAGIWGLDPLIEKDLIDSKNPKHTLFCREIRMAIDRTGCLSIELVGYR